MKVLPNQLQQACQTLKEHRHEIWHVDDSIDLEYARSNPLGQLKIAFASGDIEGSVHRQLAWLAMFVARRALPCWELYCDQKTPHSAVEAVRNWLQFGEEPSSWDLFSQPASPSFRGQPIVDCRACDTGCAAAAVASAARFVTSTNLIVAVVRNQCC